MIIGLSGVARSGKDTAAVYLEKEYGFQRVAFADKLKEIALVLNPYVPGVYAGYHTMQEMVEQYGWDELKDRSPDARRFLQVLGTEVGRNMFGEDCWVNLALYENGKPKDGIVVSDVRFPNEAEAIRDIGGVVARIERPGAGLAGGAELHPSETALDNFTFDVYLPNKGSIEDFYASIDAFMSTLHEWR